MNYKLEITNKIQKEDEEYIFNELLKYNLEHLEDKKPKDLGIYIKDEEGTIIAGIIGYTHGNWLTIKFLWVQEAIRKEGLGSKLLKGAEEEATKRGCQYVFLDTFSFQAPLFYKKHGYKEQFALEKYPITGERYYYTKKLNEQ